MGFQCGHKRKACDVCEQCPICPRPIELIDWECPPGMHLNRKRGRPKLSETTITDPAIVSSCRQSTRDRTSVISYAEVEENHHVESKPLIKVMSETLEHACDSLQHDKARKRMSPFSNASLKGSSRAVATAYVLLLLSSI